MSDEFIGNEQLIWQGRPSWRSMWSFYITWGFVALLPLLISILVAAKTDWSSQWKYTALISVVFLAFVLVIGAIRRLDVRYRITTKRISIVSGILSKHRRGTQVRYIRDWDYDQSFLERMINVGDVEFSTAGADAEDSEYVFRGILDPGGLVELLEKYMSHDDNDMDATNGRRVSYNDGE